MSRILDAAIGAAGQTLLSVTDEAAEERKQTRLEEIKNRYERMRHSERMALEAYRAHNEDQRASKSAPTTQQIEGGILSWNRDTGSWDQMMVGGKPAKPYSSPSKRQYLDPRIEALHDEYTALIGKEYPSEAEKKRIEELRPIIDKAMGMGGSVTPEGAPNGAKDPGDDRKKRLNAKLTEMGRALSGASEDERPAIEEKLRAQIQNSPFLDAQEKKAALFTLGLGEAPAAAGPQQGGDKGKKRGILDQALSQEQTIRYPDDNPPEGETPRVQGRGIGERISQNNEAYDEATELEGYFRSKGFRQMTLTDQIASAQDAANRVQSPRAKNLANDLVKRLQEFEKRQAQNTGS